MESLKVKISKMVIPSFVPFEFVLSLFKRMLNYSPPRNAGDPTCGLNLQGR